MDKDQSRTRPYVSFVAVSRNDNHGGDLTARMQAFVSGIIHQAKKFEVSCELVLVEWNPPRDRPPLAEALQWPDECHPCRVRIITVPRKIHKTYQCGDRLPLYQMIGKNVGIRRAEGEFILATNIDLLFNDELFYIFSSKKLRSGNLYRIDRSDVGLDFPFEKPFEEQIEFCRANIIRLNKKMGTIDTRSGNINAIGHPSVYYMMRIIMDILIEPPRYVFEILQTFLRYAFEKLQTFLRMALNTRYYLTYFRYAKFDKNIWSAYNNRSASDKLKNTWSASDKLKLSILYNYQMFKRPRRHTNACGDFTMLAKEDWGNLHAYADWDIFSFHIDSLLCYSACAAGLKERIFPLPARAYHIEHAAGSGFTSEHQAKLWERLDENKIPYISGTEVWSLIDDILSGTRPYQLSGPDWGMPGIALPETIVYGANKLRHSQAKPKIRERVSQKISDDIKVLPLKTITEGAAKLRHGNGNGTRERKDRGVTVKVGPPNIGVKKASFKGKGRPS